MSAGAAPQTVKDLVAEEGDVVAQVGDAGNGGKTPPDGGLETAIGAVRDADYRYAPSPVQRPAEQSFGARVHDGVALAGSVQAIERVREMLMPGQEGYDPLKDERIKGYEQYAMWLREARSPDELEAMLTRYVGNEQARERNAENGTIWSELAAGILDPSNAIIPGMAFGRGAARGAAAGLVGGFVGGAADMGMRLATDPTSDKEHVLEELFYSTAIGGVLGGLGGGLGALGDYHPAVGRLSRELTERQAQLDATLAPDRMVDGVVVARPRIDEPYRALPSDGSEGIKPTGIGLEHIVGAGGAANPLGTAWGWLVQSGHRAFQDFANQMGGDFGLVLKDNVEGVATPASAHMLAGRWRAIAADTMNELQQAYAEYLGKPDPLNVAGINLTTTGARIGGLGRRLVGRARSDGKMEFHEFEEAIFHAHRVDRLEPNLDRMTDKSEAAVAAVMKGVGIARKFFDQADREGTSSGFLPSKLGRQRHLAKRFERYDANEAAIAELAALPERTPREEAALIWRTQMRERLAATIPERAMKQRQYDRLRQEWVDGLKAGMSREDLADVHLALRTLEREGIGLRRPGQAEAVTGATSNPDTRVPPPNGAANSPLAGANDAGAALGDPIKVEPFVSGDARFDPANEPGIVVDRWEDRQGKLDPVERPPVIPRYESKVAPPQLAARLNEKIDALNEGLITFDELRQWVYADLYKDPAYDFEVMGDVMSELADTVVRGPRLDLPDYQTGTPLVADAFHGTAAVFDDFDADKLGSGTNAKSAEQGFFFARNPETSHSYLDGGEYDGVAGLQAITPDEANDLFAFSQASDEVTDTVSAVFFRAIEAAHQHTDTPLPDGFLGVLESAKRWLTNPLKTFKHLNAELTGDKAIRQLEDWRAGKIGPEVDKFEDLHAAEDIQRLAEDALHLIAERGKVDAPSNIVMGRVRMDNPLVHDFKGERYREESYHDLIVKAKAAGHDGVVFTNTFDGGPQDVIYAVFSPDQIRMRFDPANAAAAARARAAMGIIDRPAMGHLANDNAPAREGVADAVPVAARDQDGMLPGHELVAANDNDELGGPEADPHYLTRRWNNEAVRADPAALQAAFDRWHDEQGKARLTQEQFDQILAHILQGQEAGQERFTGSPVGGSFRQGRKLDIPNEHVADFIERNVGALVRDYSHRFGTGLEVHQRFGERDARDAIDDAVLTAFAERDGTAEELLAFGQEAQARMQYIRDQTLGDLHVQDPLTVPKVAAEGLKAWASTTMLGKVIFSQLVEVARPLMTHGFARNFGFITDNLIGNLQGFKAAGRDLRSIVGEGIDVAHGMTGARLMEFGDLTRPGSTMAHRTRAALDPFLSFANGPWYIMNLMGPATDITKNYVMVMSSHFLIDDMRRLAAGTAGAKKIQNLAALGIDKDMAAAMLAQPVEQTGRLNLANLGGWNDQLLANRFAAAVRGDVNRVINTPSPQSKSAISQGFLQYGDGRRQWAMVTLPMQFLSWGFSAAQKISMSALQGRDANAMGGIAALVGTAYLAQWLKTDQKLWDRTPLEERLYKAVDQSGALSILGNVNSMIEAGSMGTMGVRPLLGMDPPYGAADGYDVAGVAGGPAGTKVLDIWKAFADPSLEDWQRANIARKSIPAQGLFYTEDLFKAAQRGLMDP